MALEKERFSPPKVKIEERDVKKMINNMNWGSLSILAPDKPLGISPEEEEYVIGGLIEIIKREVAPKLENPPQREDILLWDAENEEFPWDTIKASPNPLLIITNFEKASGENIRKLYDLRYEDKIQQGRIVVISTAPYSLSGTDVFTFIASGDGFIALSYSLIKSEVIGESDNISPT